MEHVDEQLLRQEWSMRFLKQANVGTTGDMQLVINPFEEYKFFVDDTARLSERRQTVTNTYITVNGAIIGLITFLVKDAGIARLSIALITTLPLFAAGAIVCFFWYRLLMSYKRLIGFRFEQLQLIEQTLRGCHQMFTLESKHLYSKAPKKEQIEISRIERQLPLLFGLVYATLLLIIIAFEILGLFGISFVK